MGGNGLSFSFLHPQPVKLVFFCVFLLWAPKSLKYLGLRLETNLEKWASLAYPQLKL
jgi:hypothetical protein